MTKDQIIHLRALLKSWDKLADCHAHYEDIIINMALDTKTATELVGMQIEANAKQLRELLTNNFDDWSEA